MEEFESTDPTPAHLLHLYDMYRGAKRQGSIESIALTNALAQEKEKRKGNAHREKCTDGNLVLVRDFIGDKTKGRKLEPR
jgi:hypothetical protein